ncbi:MAG TPA: FAD-dependent oxidoreductase [Azospirillaceae bacterium]|nr:FAD-dependent oxidoreductase [Azospirillaceae bacterium]
MRLVLLGAGHAHLYTLKRLSRITGRGHDAVLVAPDAFWYSGLATGMLGGRYPPALDQVDVATLARRGGGRFVQARAVAMDPMARRVHLDGGGTIPFDVLSVALGSEPPELPGGADDPRVYPAKPIPRLRDLRADLEARFADARGRRRAVRVVVAGGGATAFEIAANIARLAEVGDGCADIAILAGGRPLAQLPAPAAAAVIANLRGRGITVRADARVARIEPGGAVLTDGTRVPFDVLVNATGLRPNPLLAAAGLPVDGRGAMVVDACLRSPADPGILGAGDCIALQGHELPKVGVYAVREAPVLFANLLAALGAGSPRPFRPQRVYLWIMNLGDGTGLAVRGGFWWRGRTALHLKDWLDRRFLSTYRPGPT